jgi:hypothetical protein
MRMASSGVILRLRGADYFIAKMSTEVVFRAQVDFAAADQGVAVKKLDPIA